MLDVLVIQDLEDRMLFVSKYHVCITPEVFPPQMIKEKKLSFPDVKELKLELWI